MVKKGGCLSLLSQLLRPAWRSRWLRLVRERIWLEKFEVDRFISSLLARAGYQPSFHLDANSTKRTLRSPVLDIGACRYQSALQSKADRAFCSGWVHRPSALHDLQSPSVDEAPCRAAGGFHPIPPVIRKLLPCGFARADRSVCRTPGEQEEDRLLEREVVRSRFVMPAGDGAVSHVVPTARPLLPPLDPAAASGAGFFFGHAGRLSRVELNAQEVKTIRPVAIPTPSRRKIPSHPAKALVSAGRSRPLAHSNRCAFQCKSRRRTFAIRRECVQDGT